MRSLCSDGRSWPACDAFAAVLQPHKPNGEIAPLVYVSFKVFKFLKWLNSPQCYEVLLRKPDVHEVITHNTICSDVFFLCLSASRG